MEGWGQGERIEGNGGRERDGGRERVMGAGRGGLGRQ